MRYFCCDERRRALVSVSSHLDGIDFLEVLDGESVPEGERQRTLFVRFLKGNQLASLSREQVRIDGGVRIQNIQVVSLELDPAAPVLAVQVDKAGDFSIYTLRIVAAQDTSQPPDWMDPVLSAVDFSFKVACPSDLDCRSARVCPPEPLPRLLADYLAKDYAAFRRLMLDRLAALVPQWRERHAADLGVTLVELLAYVADQLSYQQDAVATEAYLGTARRRVSVRRHARLVDYCMHDGCNARAWVQVRVGADGVSLPAGTRLLTAVGGQAVRIVPGSVDEIRAMGARPEVFETIHSASLYSAHNRIRFWTWGQRECCLPRGATRATLRDDPERPLRLSPGDVLLLVEERDPQTGNPADASPAHRHAVRLTSATSRTKDGQPLTDPLFGQPIVQVEWGVDDALPFPLCLSSTTRGGEGDFLEDVSVALGNIVLADHGCTLAAEALPEVPAPHLFWPTPRNGDPCKRRQAEPLPVRYSPSLNRGPLTQAAPDPFQGEKPDGPRPAAAAKRVDPVTALPAITLEEMVSGTPLTWKPRRDLLDSGASDRHFVVEVEQGGTARLRFGDDRFGKRPDQGTRLTAVYRMGNGTQGNVGAGAIAHIVSGEASIEGVTNPLPAWGGTEPETIEEVRAKAPAAFRIQQRAVTERDYAEVTERYPGIQRAAARMRWTGSWYTAFVTADRLGGLPVDEGFEGDLRQHLECYRMAGHDLEVDGPRYVPLELDLFVCVKPDYFRGDVKAALLDALSNRRLPDGRLGLFHPDRLSFGQAVYLSQIYAAATAVPGVASARVTLLQRWDAPGGDAIAEGRLELDRLEIARLDNDPNFPERGVLRLTLEGGR